MMRVGVVAFSHTHNSDSRKSKSGDTLTSDQIIQIKSKAHTAKTKQHTIGFNLLMLAHYTYTLRSPSICHLHS